MWFRKLKNQDKICEIATCKRMYIFASAEENNAALVSGKVTRRFPLIFSGATFPIRLLLVKWRDEPWNVEFFGWPEGESQKTQHFRAKPSTEPAKVEWEMSNQKMWVGNQAELWSWQKRSYFMKKEAKLCFPSQQCWDSQVTKNTFFIEKMLSNWCGKCVIMRKNFRHCLKNFSDNAGKFFS